MLESLKGLDLQTPCLEELVYLSAQARTLRSEYDTLNVEVPEWLDNRLREIKRRIHTMTQDAVEKRKREIKSRLDALKTPTEKRTELEKELAALEAQAVA